MNDKTFETPRTVSQFEHENDLMHYGMVNHRSMVMLIAVCVTCTLIVAIFAFSGAIRDNIREKLWLDTLTRIFPATTEVAADERVQQQPNP